MDGAAAPVPRAGPRASKHWYLKFFFISAFERVLEAIWSVCISIVISEEGSEVLALPGWKQMAFLYLEKKNTLREFQVTGQFEERGWGVVGEHSDISSLRAK